jgi:NAD(P)-dependent dehydrogenase (short-subunit alcohol dehydrogenase family)
MARPLDQQVVVISGAGSGIGRAAAKRFAEKRARLAVGGRSAEGLAAITQDVKAAGGQIVSMQLDVSRREQVEALAKLAMDTYGRVDTWVNNAGVSIYGKFDAIPEEEIRRLFDVNLWGTVYGMWTAMPLLRAAGGGTIINVASVVGKRGLPLQNFYSASKFAIIGLSEAVRVELRTQKANINVCAVCPPSIDTPFYDNSVARMGYAPRPLPVVLPADTVAKDIVSCAVRPRREVWVGLVGKAFVSLSVLFPWFMDWFILRLGFQAQLSNEPKTPEGESGLFRPTKLTSVDGRWSAWGQRR